GGNEVADVIAGRLAVHHDLLGDDVAFEIDLLPGKGGVPDDVGGDFGEKRQRVGVAAGLVNDLVLGGAGVERAAAVLDLQTDRPGVAPAGAFEDHVFDEVRRAGQSRRVVAAAGGHVDG